MSVRELEAAVAAATGDSVSTIRGRGFTALAMDVCDLEPEDLPPPQVLDWDTADVDIRAQYIDDIVE